MCCIQHSSRDGPDCGIQGKKGRQTHRHTYRKSWIGWSRLSDGDAAAPGSTQQHPAAPCVYYSHTEAGHYKEPNKEMALANLRAVSVGSSPSGSEYGAGKLWWTFSLYTVNIQTGTRYWGCGFWYEQLVSTTCIHSGLPLLPTVSRLTLPLPCPPALRSKPRVEYMANTWSTSELHLSSSF